MKPKKRASVPEDQLCWNQCPELAPELALLTREDIAVLGYPYWEARAFRDGSPENDWHRAVEELRRRKLLGVPYRVS